MRFTRLKTHKMGEGLFRVLVTYNRRSDTTLWTAGKARKESKCEWCGITIRKGDNAFRPVGNQLYRMNRLCGRCIEKEQDNGT